MSLLRDKHGNVTHDDSIQEIKVVNRRQAESAFCTIVTKLEHADVDMIDDEISALRDFIWSR